MKRLLFTLLLTLFFHISMLQAQSPTYTKIRIPISDSQQISDLIQAGILIEHFSKNSPNSIEIETSTAQINILRNKNINYEVLIEDVQAHYLSHLSTNTDRKMGICGLDNFDFGTMGHYHTYEEVISQLDSMAAKFPDLISPKISIGTSIEGRSIYAVKISDHPNTDETDIEGSVYLDALHHAREPMSMESLLYYMWWLLENYNNDADATYLVNHREIHFVPVVNPDGYVYNQTTNPSGGGFWRKNRRVNPDGSFGVDLNRNYSSSFGDPIGSSSNPSSETYRGESAFSEPETQAVRDYLDLAKPAIAFCCHTFGQKFITSPGCFYPLEDFESYAEFSSGFINNSFDGYGTTSQMLGYSSCGTTRHYMHDNDIYAWTPEIGTSFWPLQTEFCTTVQNFLEPMKYISFVAGSYPQLNDFSVTGMGYVEANDTLEVKLRLKNRGIQFAAENVEVSVRSLTPNCTDINTVTTHESIAPRTFVSNDFQLLVDADAQLLDKIILEITIKENGFISQIVNKEVTVGKTNVLFEDDAEDGLSQWNTSTWDTTFIDFQSGLHAIADSRYGNYEANDLSTLRLSHPIDLTDSHHPILMFNAKWSLEDTDEMALQISSNGVNWTTLGVYSLHQNWVQLQFDLSNYIGEMVEFRLRLSADSNVQSDGFYFDDFRVLDFVNSPPSSTFIVDLSDVSIYPNPAHRYVNIDKGHQSKIAIELWHCTGQLMYRTVSEQQVTTLPLEGYANGTYFVTIRTDEGAMSQKMVVH